MPRNLGLDWRNWTFGSKFGNVLENLAFLNPSNGRNHMTLMVVFFPTVFFMKNWEISCFKHKLSYLESTDDEVFSREKKQVKRKLERRRKIIFSVSLGSCDYFWLLSFWLGRASRCSFFSHLSSDSRHLWW